MTAPLADQLFDALGEPTIRAALRCLLVAPATQPDLISDLGCNQSTVSRAISLLRSLGVIEESGSRKSPIFRVVHRDRLVAVLLDGDRLAEAIIKR